MKYSILILLLIGFQQLSLAQVPISASPTNDSITQSEVELGTTSMNIVKINLFPLALKTLTVQYERVINKYLSVAASMRIMPETNLPHKDFLYNVAGADDPEFKEMLDNMRVNNFAITPEVRFYLGKKGFNRGFYIAPSYRHARFGIDNVEYSYLDEESNVEYNIKMNGKMRANYGGFMLGVHWALGKHMSLDWWILGPFLGHHLTRLSGQPSEPIPEDIQDEIKEELEDLSIPYNSASATVTSTSVELQINGLIPSLSTGLAFGVRF